MSEKNKMLSNKKKISTILKINFSNSETVALSNQRNAHHSKQNEIYIMYI